jgi:hypothetical protein
VNFFKALFAALPLIGVSGFRLGAYIVTATTADAPHHLTIGEAVFAVEKVLAKQPGSFQVGSVSITVAPYSG